MPWRNGPPPGIGGRWDGPSATEKRLRQGFDEQAAVLLPEREGPAAHRPASPADRTRAAALAASTVAAVGFVAPLVRYQNLTSAHPTG